MYVVYGGTIQVKKDWSGAGDMPKVGTLGSEGSYLGNT